MKSIEILNSRETADEMKHVRSFVTSHLVDLKRLTQPLELSNFNNILAEIGTNSQSRSQRKRKQRRMRQKYSAAAAETDEEESSQDDHSCSSSILVERIKLILKEAFIDDLS